MARRGGWRRDGSQRRFRYVDARGNRITDPAKLARIEALVIPPAWRDVWISPRPGAKLQATGVDAAGRTAVPVPPRVPGAAGAGEVRQADPLCRALPELREAMAEHMELDPLERERVVRRRAAPDQPRLVPRRLRALRAGVAHVRDHDADEAARRRPRQAGSRFSFRGKHKRLGPHAARRCRARRGRSASCSRYPAVARCSATDEDGDALQPDRRAAERLHQRAPRRGVHAPRTSAPGAARWSPRSRSPSAACRRREAEAKRTIAAVMRPVGERLGNTPAVARARTSARRSIEQYLDGRTIDDFRPRHLRVVGARDIGLDREETALLSLLRSWRIRRARAGRVDSRPCFR